MRKTPYYIYDLNLLRKTLASAKKEAGNFKLHYAIKANFNPVLLKEIAAAGFGADCVSGGEVAAALEAGFPPESIVFAGVGKSDEEIIFSLENHIARFNVESAAELKVIEELAKERELIADISIRVNPDIDAHTVANITTGLAENKFGISCEQLEDVVRLALELSHVRFRGLHCHIGSQILDMNDFAVECARLNEIRSRLQSKGLPVGDINAGGGLGVDYVNPDKHPIPDFKRYFEVFREHLNVPEGTEVHFELGRSLVAQCGSLISRVLYIKDGASKRFAIIDASMTELVRPAMYHARHRIDNLSSKLPEQVYDIVGPVCESSDVFAKNYSVQECRRGDYIAIRSAGAYGESMASRYNLHPLPEAFFTEETDLPYYIIYNEAQF